MYLQLQPELFAEFEDAVIYHGSATEVVGSKAEFFTARNPKLFFIDPLFNIGHGYKSADDKMSREQHLAYLLGLFRSAYFSANNGTTIAWHLPKELLPDVFMIANILKAEGCDLLLRGHVINHYRFGQCRSTWFNDTHAHLLFFNVGERLAQFNATEVLTQTDRAKKYGDKRTQSRAKNSVIPAGFKVVGDVWGIEDDGEGWGRVQGTSKERWSLAKFGDQPERDDGPQVYHPNQLRLRYLKRIISALTSEGDCIADFSLGTGTSWLMANAMNRKFIGFDVCADTIRSACNRLQDDDQIELAAQIAEED